MVFYNIYWIFYFLSGIYKKKKCKKVLVLYRLYRIYIRLFLYIGIIFIRLRNRRVFCFLNKEKSL